MEDAECLAGCFCCCCMHKPWWFILCLPFAEGQGALLSPNSKTAAAARLSKAARKLEVRLCSCRPNLAPSRTLKLPECIWQPDSDSKAALRGLHAW